MKRVMSYRRWDFALNHYYVTRFWLRVEDNPGGCWNWTSTMKPNGYGHYSTHPDQWLAHRFAYTATYGPIPDGLFVCHTCDNRRCVRPAHLFLGTHDDNMRDMVAKKRQTGVGQTHCKYNHEYTEANTIRRPNGRTCRTCAIAKDIARRPARNAAIRAARAARRAAA